MSARDAGSSEDHAMRLGIILCWARTLWDRYWNPADIPISGHRGQELENGDIVCTDCGKLLWREER